ncbi:MAG: hypothetical protein EHM64_08355 [Ignavibacteriae bacterium]|nr:MAG: hypothetical protein EHM64_08355 [Ignavibacteriota bacterium]
MKNLFAAVIVSVTCLLLLSCSKDETTSPPSAATGTVQGTVTFISGTPSATKLLVVGIYPFSNTNMQGAPDGSTIQMISSSISPFSYSFAVPPGDYHLITMFDANGDGSYNSGMKDPYIIYTPNNPSGTPTFGSGFDRFTVSAGQTYTANVTFGDSFKK